MTYQKRREEMAKKKHYISKVDACLDSFDAGFYLAIEMLRTRSIECNEPDPVMTGLNWADWLEEQRGEG